jgi:Flp pilus assembly protein CpaB
MPNPDPARSNVSRRALVASAVSTCVGVVLFQIYERRLVAETSGGEPVAVLTLIRDVPAGAALGRDTLGVRAVPEAYLERRSIHEVDLDKVLGLKVALGLRATESLLWTDLVAGRPEARDLSALIAPGSRAVTVESSTFDGLLRPGDRVDVLPASSHAGAELLQNLLVVAVGGNTEPDLVGAPAQGRRGGVTLTGTAEQGAAIAEAAREGEVGLSLRNPDDAVIAERPQDGAPRRAAPGVRASEIEHVR